MSSWYKVGSISVTNGSATVTGSGTAWILNAQVGEALYAPDGRLYEITNIASDTSMTVSPAYLGTTQTGQSYVIVPSQSYIRDLAAQAADLVNNYSTIANTIGVGKFPDGTISDLGFKFADDLDTGFFRSATNEVTFVAGGVAQFKYNASGLVFVGATALDLQTLKLNGTTVTSTAAELNLLDGATVTTAEINLLDGVTATTAELNILDGVTATASEINKLDGASNLVEQTDIGTAPNEIPLNQHLGNLAYQDAENIAGDVGVGGDLDVTGVLSLSANPVLSGGTANGVVFLNGSKVATSGSALTFDGTDFGIGIGNPQTKLHVTKGNLVADYILRADDNFVSIDANQGGTASNPALVVGGDTDTGWYRPASNIIAFSTAGSERLRIDSAGNVGIGTSSAFFGLDIQRPNSSTLNLYNTTATSNDSVEAQVSSFNGTYWNVISHNASSFRWKTFNGERMSLDSTGHLIVPEGITLGTTAGTYNAANTLDDYEEGTWTPTALFSISNGDVSYVRQVGKYVKVGNLVHIQGYMAFSETTASGNLVISGLPFAASTIAANYVGATVFSGNLANVSGQIQVLIGGDIPANQMFLYYTGTGSLTRINETNTGAGTDFAFSICYQTP